MQTLEQLRKGQLQGITRLQLSEELKEFPIEILELAETLEILDLSNNQLRQLPNELSQLKNLRIIFASNNLFTELPEVLGQCPKLEMVGFKANQISHVPSNSLPETLRWLILTDNKIAELPDSLGNKPRLQKLALAGNQLTSLPKTVNQLNALELIRLSANALAEFPKQLLELPRLAWIAFSGNPFCQREKEFETVPHVSFEDLQLNQVLGQGASGVISHADWKNTSLDLPEEVAVKVFKGEITSDGYPEDELQACLQAGTHENLIKSLAQISEPAGLALVMELIPNSFFNLGLPPSLQSCTRDTFEDGFSLSIEEISKIVTQMTDVFHHLHRNKVCHGDLYAHNVLVNDSADMIFGDFGAASVYGYLPLPLQQGIFNIELRALGFFIEDLLSICDQHRSVSKCKEFQKLEQQARQYIN